jgi:hypothetical protein
VSGDPLPTGVTVVDTTVLWSVAVVTVAGALALALRLMRSVARMARAMEELREDWQGEPGRPGVPRRPGVMERLGGIELRLANVEHELHPNSGHSLRDAVDRVAKSVCPAGGDNGDQAASA